MAQRERDKAKRAPARQEGGATQLTDTVQRLEARARSLEAELETARARIAQLENSRKDVANRIDWVIDSLRSLNDKRG